MNISVVGASGDIGREIVTKLVETGAMDRDAVLQLIGREDGCSVNLLYGLMSDLLDAHAEVSPRMEVVFEPEDIRGDLVIFCAGQTISTDPHQIADRSSLASVNAGLFDRYARAIAKSGNNEQIVIIVSNPVELAVHIFARYIHRSKVIGMGAFLDTVRFRREIAEDLEIRRQRVRGMVVGQHGPGMVPLWSTVGVFGYNNKAGKEKIDKIRNKNRMDPGEAIDLVRGLLCEGKAKQAYERIRELPPDLRVLVEPFITHMSGAKTRVGTAEIVLRMVDKICMGTQILTSCQLKIEGEFLGVHSVIGVPVLLDNQGITEVHPIKMWENEIEAFRRSAENINQFLSDYKS